ncbi:MAG: M20 family peptidase, partial [Alphaproteobacteria bacterium]|nr:M20 family peptidase [Alphaproteobacteria bacterium]
MPIAMPSSETLLEELRTWVEIETPSADPAAVNRLVDLAESGLRAAGASIERVPG